MAWIIGIDEAGYGPNLGPLVMTAAACRVPDEVAGADLWQRLRAAVRRRAEPDDGRLLIEDSKQVYSPARGLLDLETGVLAALSCGAPGDHLQALLGRLCPASAAELAGEPWYTGRSALPVAALPADLAAAAARFGETCRGQQVAWGPVRSVVIGAAQFNRLAERAGSKGAVLAHGLGELLRAGHDPDDSAEPVHVCVDKHGGRNTYAAMIQAALPDGFVAAEEEGAARSRYRVLGLRRELRLTFRPRADGEHFCVALASMVSKYLREVLMAEFNRFWQAQIPGLKPTAGYPVDAARFFAQIRPALDRLGIPEDAVWRRK